MEQLVSTLQPYFTTNAPFQLPEEWRKNIVRVAPWIALIAAVLGGLAALGLLFPLVGWSAFLGIISPWFTLMSWMAFAALVGQTVLMALAYNGLKRQQIEGWNYVFYGALLSIAWSLFNWLQYPSNIGALLGAAIAAAVELFILFQIRGYYTGAKKVASKPSSGATESKSV